MKQKILIFVTIIICIFSIGCQAEQNSKNHTIEEIEAALKNKNYNIEYQYDGLYDPGDKVIQVWLKVEDNSGTTTEIISYKDEKTAKESYNEVKKDGFSGCIRKGNIIGIYNQDMYSNIEEIIEKILECEPIEYDSAILKLK